jgi:hypothetical protein
MALWPGDHWVVLVAKGSIVTRSAKEVKADIARVLESDQASRAGR